LRSLHQYLVTVAVLLVLLIFGAAAIIIYEVDRFARAQSEQQLLATTRALSLVVDGELKRYEAVLRVLSTSESVDRQDWAAIDQRARKLLDAPDVWIVVSDRSGRQLVNTRLQPGATLPGGAAVAQMWKELDTGQSRICNLTKGRVEPTILCVDVPAVRGGRAEIAFSVILRPAQLTSILKQQRPQEGSFATVVDRRGIVVWRNSAAERFIGKPATQDIRNAIANSREGVRESYSLEGIPTVAAFSRSLLSGWTFIVAVPRDQMRAGTTRALILAGGGAGLLLLVGALVGVFAARRVSLAVRSLAVSAGAIERGEQPVYSPTGLSEIDAAGHALGEALRARRISEDRYRLIFEQTSDLILTADLHQVITDCNPSAAAAVGVRRDQAIGRSIAEFVSPDDYSKTTDMLGRKLAEGGTTTYDLRVRSNSGEWLYWEINSGLAYDREGNPIGLYVLGRDITERKRAEEQQSLMVNELNHRVKNTLAVVQSIAHQTLKGEHAAAREALQGRLSALSAAHDVLTRESWASASIREIVANALAPFCDASRCKIDGPDLRMNPRTCVSLALAVHELATNAVKYGALANTEGMIVVRWSTESDRLSFEWREHDGPPVAPPSRRGFGSRMIERALGGELGGRAEMQFNQAGLIFTLDAPLPRPE
jgi:PAS domain S-box-containing protein